MGKIREKKRSFRPNQGPPLSDKTDLNKYFWFAYAALYLSVGLLYWPSVRFSAISLDDTSHLKYFADKALTQVWGYDHFGQLRPAKNLLFWILARDLEHLSYWRAGIICAFLISGLLVQRLAAGLLGSRWWGLAVALCWALNPTTPSAVCWLSAANIALCLLGTLVYLLLGERALSQNHRSPSASRLMVAAALLGFLVALMSHQLALLAPALLLVYRRIRRSAQAERSQALPLALGSVVCTVALFALYALGTPPHTGYRFSDQPKWLLVLSAARYLFENARLWFWQKGRFGVLLVDVPADHLLASAICWLLLLGACALFWRIRKRDAAVTFGTLWFTAFLFPVTNLVPLGNTPVAVHYLYLPGVGLALVLCRALQRLALRVSPLSPWRASILTALILGAVIAAWLPEHQQTLTAWAGAERIYAVTVRNYPRNIEARVNLSAVYLTQRRFAQAATLLAESLRLAPQERGLIRNRFELLWQTGQAQQALDFLDAHAFLDGPLYMIRRGKLLEMLERRGEAVQAFRRAFDKAAGASNDRFAAGYHLAMALVQTGRLQQARQLVERLLEEYPGRQELLIAKQLLANEVH